MKPRAGLIVLFVLTASFCPAQARSEETMSWESSVAEARKNHPDLVSAREKLNQSQAAKTQTASAFFPQISGELNASTSKTPSSSKSTGSSVSSRTDSYDYGVSGKQLLFDGFKTYFDVEQAAKNIEASRYNYEVTSSNVKLRLRTAYVDLLKAQELLIITRDIVKRRRQSEELIKLRYDVGRENKGSLLTAQANLSQAELEAQEAGRALELAQRRLCKELGRVKFSPLKAADDFKLLKNDASKPEFENLAETTPFLKELVVQKEAAKWGVKSAAASFFPQVYANASAGRTDSSWPPDKDEWSAGASFSMPFFEGGNLVAAASKAGAQYRQLAADERSGRDGVILTLADTWTQYRDAADQVGVQKKFLEAALERSKIAEAQYSAGLITFNDWIIIENNLVQAQKSFLDAQANSLLAEAAWAQAKGETLDEN